MDIFHPVEVIISEEPNARQLMDIKLQFACLQKDGNMVKTTPVSRGDFSRIQIVN